MICLLCFAVLNRVAQTDVVWHSQQTEHLACATGRCEYVCDWLCPFTKTSLTHTNTNITKIWTLSGNPINPNPNPGNPSQQH